MPRRITDTPLRRLLSLSRDPILLASVERMIEMKTPEARERAKAALALLLRDAPTTKRESS